MKKEIIKQVEEYYTNKIKQHGATPQGVDWNGTDSQYLRFQQLMKIVNDDSNNASFSLLDYGCGYGAMLDYLMPIYGNRIKFSGYDISEEMITKAKSLYGNKAEFSSSLNSDSTFDYIVASGIFNVKQDCQDSVWQEYIHQILVDMNTRCLKGFAFNILTSYSDKEYIRDYLYYASPEDYFSYCKVHFSKRVALLHDYPLYEFTILVKK